MIRVHKTSLHEDISPDQYWCHGTLNDLLAGDLWPHDLKFQTTTGIPQAVKGEGMICVVPGDHHAGDVDELNRLLAPASWVLWILTGDEASLFPALELAHPNQKVWVQTPHPIKHQGVDRVFGFGYRPATPQMLRLAHLGGRRDLDWAFAGQIADHVGRQQMRAALADMPNGFFLGTEGFGQGLPQATYLGTLVRAKIALCPSGPWTPDSFRLFEAIEAGCAPIVEACSPQGGCEGFWEALSPADPVPFPVLPGWRDVGACIAEQLPDWASHAAAARAWWGRRRKELADWLEADLIDLSGAEQRMS